MGKGNHYIQQFKRWSNIVLGQSAVAVDQGVGKCFSKDEIKGYYNDLTNKVTGKTLLDDDGVPYNIVTSGNKAYVLVTIFQYALGCYDLYCLEESETYREKFLYLAKYALNRQDARGGWDARESLGSSKGNSSCMVQAQGCSILLRANLLNHDSAYATAAKRAIDFMLLPVEEGGTAHYDENDLYLEKYPPEDGKYSSVLNGWIFGLFGLYDYILFSGDEEYRNLWQRSCTTLEKTMPKYDRHYWSNYDVQGKIASPAYNATHATLLKVMAQLSNSQILDDYSDLFAGYQTSGINRVRAILRKLIQKISKPSDAFIVQ